MSGLSTTATGSPPRMREEFHLYAHRVYSAGITPAHAGRMSESSPYWFFHWDHPRACGKNISEEREQELKAGSPPRMREEFNKYPSHKLLWRITPAHAGRMWSVQGESIAEIGSPPRMREE